MINEKNIVLDTVEFYSDSNNRAIFYTSGGPEDATSRYVSTNGNKCAVGRFLKDEVLEGLAELNRLSRKVSYLAIDNSLDRVLKDEYKGHSLAFWKKLQRLHDTHHFWSNDGITKEGIKFVSKNFGISLTNEESIV
jgi:hypothetical protein